jgi:hypothetical protein
VSLFFELLSDLLSLLLEHVDLLDLLLELGLDHPLFRLRLLHLLLSLVTLPLDLLLLTLYLFLFFLVLFVLFNEFLSFFSVLLLNFDDLILVVVLHPVELFVVDLLE